MESTLKACKRWERTTLCHIENPYTNDKYIRDMYTYIYDIYGNGIICIYMRGAGHSFDNCLWDSAGIQRCLWGESLWFISYAYEVIDWSSEGSCESGHKGHGKKNGNDYEKERDWFCILLSILGGIGEYIYVYTYSNHNNYECYPLIQDELW